MLKQTLPITFATCVFLSSLTARADSKSIPQPPPPVAGEVDVGAAISPMKKGQVAPFTGVLLSPKAVASIITELDSIPKTIKIEVDKARGDEKAKCDFRAGEAKAAADADAKVAAAKIESNMKRIGVLEDELKKERDARPNLGVWVAAGFVGGVVVTAATTYVILQAAK